MITLKDASPEEQKGSKLIIKRDSLCFLFFNPLKHASKVD